MIITNDEQALRAICQPVELQEATILIEALENELNYANRLGKSGIGLASIQTGVNKKCAIVRLPKISLNLVNAEIKQGYDKAFFEEEGCLSYPGIVENTIRYQELHVINNLVEPHSFIATGLLAVCVAHEIEHYNSTLFFDHKVPKQIPIVRQHKVGPNDPCICGSNKKYKRCCQGVK
jgi:peptide deformylase